MAKLPDGSTPAPGLRNAYKDRTMPALRPFNPSSIGVAGVLDAMLSPVWVFDIDCCSMIWANSAACRMWKAESLAELCGRDFASDMSVTVATRLKEYQRGFKQSGATYAEVWTHYPKGEPSTIRVHYSGVRLQDGRYAMLCEGGEEVKETPDKLRSAEALVHTSVMITLHEEDGTVLYCNPAASTRRRTPSESLQAHFVRAADYETLAAALKLKGEANLVAEVYTIQGLGWHEITARRCKDPVTGKPAWLTSEVDVSEIKRTEEQARYDAHHDPLTGLPNRTFVHGIFEGRLQSLLERSVGVAVLFFDLDRFKAINDSLGHANGDQLLIETASRLRRAVGVSGDVARLGGDEFLMLLEFTSTGELEDFERTLFGIIRAPFVIGKHSLRVTPSVGISLAFRDSHHGIAELVKNADAAMRAAKTAGGNRSAHYTADMGELSLARVHTEMQLRRDFDEGHLQVYYQPRVSLASGRIVSAEALLRWPTADGFISPDVFIPIAEENGTIVQIGAWVLQEVLQQQARWRLAGHDLKLSVNVSPRQLAEGNFVGLARQAIASTGLSDHGVELEITERLFLGEQHHIVDALRELQAEGFGISVDDFGVGYSNLAELNRYPINCLKIDRSFIRDLTKHGPITELIINMSKLMKLLIVAEGVETEAQLQWLRDRGCDEYQGYYYSRPVPVEAFEQLLTTGAAFSPEVPQSKLVA